MKISAIQFSPTLGNLNTTITDLNNLFPQAADSELIVLPELANSGYNFLDKEQAWATAENISDSIFVKFLQEKSRIIGSTIVSGFNERNDNKLYNSAILIHKGEIIGKYQKLHLFYREKEFFRSGTMGLPVFEVGDIKIGIQICFDWMYPEAWRILALKGADIICHPSNLVLPGMAQQAVPVHAMINRIFTITANRTGSERDLTYTGDSTIASPRGKVLSQASSTKNEVITVEIDPFLGRNKFVTPLNHIFEDRNPKEYRFLVNSEYAEVDD